MSLLSQVNATRIDYNTRMGELPGIATEPDKYRGVVNAETRRGLSHHHVHIEEITVFNLGLHDAILRTRKGESPSLLTPEGIHQSLTEGEQREASSLRRKKIEYAETVRRSIELDAEKVAGLFKQADLETKNASPEVRAAARLDKFGSRMHIITDCDLTLTDKFPEESELHKLSLSQLARQDISHITEELRRDPRLYLPLLIPGSALAEPMLNPDRSNFEEVFVKVWQPALLRNEGLFRRAGELVTLRPGIDEFVEETQARDGKITIVSANFRPFIEGVRSQIKNGENLGIYAITSDNVNSTAKGEVIKELILLDEDAKKRVGIFIGDGGSDAPALEASPITAFYFALHGGGFEHELERANVLHFPYNDFNDIRAKLDQIQSIKR